LKSVLIFLHMAALAESSGALHRSAVHRSRCSRRSAEHRSHLLRRLTFELSGRRRHGARHEPVKMYSGTTGPGLVACRWRSA
jgi:hypothetical protein